MGIFYNKRHCVILKKIRAKIYLAKITQFTHNHNKLISGPPLIQKGEGTTFSASTTPFIIRINLKIDYGFYNRES